MPRRSSSTTAVLMAISGPVSILPSANRRKTGCGSSRAVEQSPAIIVITDLDGRIQYVNPKFTQVTGYGAEEVTGENPRILNSGETPQEVYSEIWATIRSGGEWRGEFHNRKKNGELYWVSASISPIKDPSAPSHISLLFRKT